MTDSNKPNEPTIDAAPAGRADTNLTRRRIMKGVAAVAPAVLTLHSGKAMALHSVYECIGKDADINPPVQYRDVPVPDDGSVRTTVDGQFLFFEDDRTLRLACDDDNDANTPDKLCVVYVDETGGSVNVDGTGKPLTDSCYDSFL